MKRPGSRRQPGTTARRSTSVVAPSGAISPWVQLRSGTAHPFIFQRMVRNADSSARPGDVVNIYDKSGALFGRGLYNPSSMIVLRVLAYGDTPIDDTYWRSTLTRAVDLRRRLRIDESTDAYRLVHAEGDGLSGLIVERYADCLVFEVFSLGIFQRCQMLAQHLSVILNTSAQNFEPRTLARAASGTRADNKEASWRVVVRADEFIERTEGFRVESLLQPELGRLVIREHGIRYRVDATGGQKTGFFCDQRENRKRFALLCRDANVLDLCCYTGGFSLCAKVLGKASTVTGVDLDESAVAVAKENANLNQTRVDFVHSDAFAYLRLTIANGRRFDAVILDPPKLAATRNDVDGALRKYNDLNSLAMQVVRPDGVLVTCSCSGLVSRPLFKEMVFRAARRAGVSLQVFEETGAGPDHPVAMNCPESEYLKVLWTRVRAES